MQLQKAVRASGMECPAWLHRAGTVSISVPHTDVVLLISSLGASHTHSLLQVPFMQTLSQPYTASFVLFPLSGHHPPTHSLQYFLRLWFSCRRLPSVPCLTQQPVFPNTQTPSLLLSICRAEAFPFIVWTASATTPISRLFIAVTHLEWKWPCWEPPHSQCRRANSSSTLPLFVDHCFLPRGRSTLRLRRCDEMCHGALGLWKHLFSLPGQIWQLQQ